MTQKEIYEICEQWYIDPVGAELFNEDWIISRKGDITATHNFGCYALYAGELNNPKWFAHMKHKRWCDMENFVGVFIEALCRIGLNKIEMNKDYQSEEMIVLRPFELRNAKRAQELLISKLR